MKNKYAVNLALEASRMTGPLLRVQHKRVKVDHGYKAHVYCYKCQSFGPLSDAKHELEAINKSIEAWNKRQ